MTQRIIEAPWPEGRQAIENLRREVFVLEQQVPEALEWDNTDASAKHFCLLGGAELIAYARLLMLNNGSGKLTRMAVQRHRRGEGLGSELLLHVVKSGQKLGLSSIKLDAQVHAVGFYQRHGFVPEGAVFCDAGIEHLAMQINLTKQ